MATKTTTMSKTVFLPNSARLLATIACEEVDEQPTRAATLTPKLQNERARNGAISLYITLLLNSACIRAKEGNDSAGDAVTCIIRNIHRGFGEPVFNRFEAKLAQAMFSIPTPEAFEVGSGFKGTEVPGPKHNDPLMLNNRIQGGPSPTRGRSSGREFFPIRFIYLVPKSAVSTSPGSVSSRLPRYSPV